jgi:hypothetical protein
LIEINSKEVGCPRTRPFYLLTFLLKPLSKIRQFRIKGVRVKVNGLRFKVKGTRIKDQGERMGGWAVGKLGRWKDECTDGSKVRLKIY